MRRIFTLVLSAFLFAGFAGKVSAQYAVAEVDAVRHSTANKAVTCLLGACELLSQARIYLREAVA